MNDYYTWLASGTPVYTLMMNRDEARELLALLNRAVNTLEPKDWPVWLDAVLKHLEQFSHAKT